MTLDDFMRDFEAIALNGDGRLQMLPIAVS
jgi:hypothetical protein